MELKRLIQSGTVMTVDPANHKARVKLDAGIPSGWLYVLQHPGMNLHLVPDAKHTHKIQDSYTGGGSADTFPAHNHPQSYTTDWMPQVNDRVLCLYLPVPDGDGFILGRIG